jgi:hypothetical protein
MRHWLSAALQTIADNAIANDGPPTDYFPA